MKDDYIVGRISVMFAGFRKETVQLEFTVQGRVATLDLDIGDTIELVDQEPEITLTTDDILDSFEEQGLKRHKKSNGHWSGESYQGRKVRVKLNRNTTKQIQKRAKDQALADLLKSIEKKSIKASEALEIMKRWEEIEEEETELGY